MEEASTLTCPNCGRPRLAAVECPRCGVIYTKAHARARPERVPPEAGPDAMPLDAVTLDEAAPAWDDGDAAALEFRLRLVAIPAALLGAWLVVHAGFLRMLLRTVLSMWVHESGHAVTAWLCGFPAFPLPWLTPTADARAAWVSLALLGGVVFVGVRFGRQGRWLPVGACLVALVLQAVGTLRLSPSEAHTWITFGGDGGAMVLGTLLMLSVYADPRGAVRRGWLHWGFLVIGAGAFADAFETWWAARTDVDRIPFGAIEGVGLSDPSRLVEQAGWTYQELIGRYVTLGGLCLAVLAFIYVRGLLQARRSGPPRSPPPGRRGGPGIPHAL